MGTPQEGDGQVGFGSELRRQQHFSLQVLMKYVLSGPPMGSLTAQLHEETSYNSQFASVSLHFWFKRTNFR